jgi:hypothetical protein
MLCACLFVRVPEGFAAGGHGDDARLQRGDDVLLMFISPPAISGSDICSFAMRRTLPEAPGSISTRSGWQHAMFWTPERSADESSRKMRWMANSPTSCAMRMQALFVVMMPVGFILDAM